MKYMGGYAYELGRALVGRFFLGLGFFYHSLKKNKKQKNWQGWKPRDWWPSTFSTEKASQEWAGRHDFNQSLEERNIAKQTAEFNIWTWSSTRADGFFGLSCFFGFFFSRTLFAITGCWRVFASQLHHGIITSLRSTKRYSSDTSCNQWVQGFC